MKKVFSWILSLALIFSLLPNQVFAASTLEFSSEKEGEKIVVTLTLPKYEKVMAAEAVVEFSDALKLESVTSGTYSPLDFEEPNVETATTKGKVTIGHSNETLGTATIEGEYAKLTFSIKDGTAPGSYDIKLTELTMTATDYVTNIAASDAATLPKTISVVVPKAPITSVSAKVDAPQKGVTLDTSVDLDSATAYTGAVEWYKGDTAAGTAVTGPAAANQVYTAKITLTAKTTDGESFDSSLGGNTTAEGYKIKFVDAGKLELTKTFGPTAIKDTPSITIAPTASAITYGQKLSNSTLSGGEAKVGSTVISGTFKWKTSSTAPQVKDSNSTEYEVVFTPSDTASYESATCKVKLTVNKKTLSSLATDSISDQPFTGSPITPTFRVMNGTDFYEILDPSDYEVTFTNNTNVGKANYTIKETPTGNYKFNTSSGTFKIIAGTSSISIIDDPSKPYDGNVVADPAVSKSGSTGAVTYTYYTNAACTTKTTTASGAASDGAAPKNAGDYWVTATVAASGNYGSATSVAKKFTISQKDLTDSMITLGTQKTYNGTEQSVQIASVKDSGASLTAAIDYTIERGDKAADVGNNTLVIKGKGNYTGEARATWSLVAKDVTITPDAKSKTYGAADPALTYTTSIDSDTTLKGKFDAAKSGALDRASGDNVGMYAIKLGMLKAGNNFKLTLPTTPVYLTITPKNVADAEVTATISDQTTIKGVGEFVDPVIKGVKGEDLTGTLTYGYDSETGKSHAEVVTMLKGKNVNDVVTLTYTFTPPSGNYTGTKTGSFKVTVKDIEFLVNGTPATVANTLTVKADPTYGDDWSDIVKKQSGVTITAKVGAATDADQSHFTLRPTGKPSAGNGQAYELVYNGTINGTNYANVVVVSGTVNVAPKTLTKSDLVYTGQITKTYDGSDSAPTGLTVSVKSGSLVGTDTLTVTGTLKYNSANVNAANEITFTPTAIITGNYRLAATEVLTITGAKITAKDVKLTGGINATDRSYVKDNKTVDLTKGTLTFDGLVGSETLDVNIPATGTISDAKVGAYNVTYSGVTLADGTGKASNYKLVSPLPAVMVNITKAAALTLADIPVSQKFTTTTGEKAIGAVMPTDAGALTYTKDAESKTGSVTVTSWDVDSTGKVTYTLSGGVAGDTVTLPVIIGSDNYENSTVNVKITLTAKDDQTALTLTGGTTVVYGQTLQLGTTGGNGTGAVTYAVTNGTGEATIDATGKLTPVKVGTVKVKATKAEDANYNAITSAEVEITITRATPTGAPKYTAITTSGKTLADAGLTTAGSTLNPNAGTLVWVDNAGTVLPDTTAVAANTTYKWLFTPTDTNYTTLTGSIELYHKSSGGGGGWYYTYYTIKATAGTNGSISPSGWTSVRDGRDQTFTITPDKGYAVAKVLVDGKSVGAVKSYTFKNVTKDHTIEAVFMKSNGNPQTGVFVDVAEGSYYEEAIDWAVEKSITNGVSSNMFAPNDPCTRAQIVTFLWRAAGSPAPKSMSSFTDVPADAFYAKAVAWAVENGITSGTGESKFSPNSTCTRAQAVTFLYRASGSPAVSGKAEFSDVSTTAFYADAVAWAAKKGITTGIGGGLFGSDNDCTRGQIVTFLWRAMAE